MASHPVVIRVFVLILASLHLNTGGVFAQNCYYPNGDVAEGEAACSSDGGTCCPLNWACMDNGLCYLENEGYYERHTCTDRSWQSSSCPEICTQSDTASGNEAILWCPSGDWCCDGNRSWNCCTTADTNFFSLPKPHSIAFISNVGSATPVPFSSNSPQSSTGGTSASASASMEDMPSATNEGSSQTSTSSASASPSTQTHETVTTGKDGSVATVTEKTTFSPASTDLSGSQADSTNHSSSNLGMIVGLALGIPLVLILSAILIFCLCRRHRKSKRYANLARPESPPMIANYNDIAPGSHAPELDSYPVAPKRTRSGRKSELYGSDAYLHSPSLSTGTSETSPPQYSPGGKSPGMTQIPEEPQELWGGYVPYRPPNAQVSAER